MLEPPNRILLPLATELEVADAADFGVRRMRDIEQDLLLLSDAIAARYFLQGANAVPTVKLAALA